MIWFSVFGVSIVAIGRSNIYFASKDGFNASFFGCSVKIDNAIHHSMVGDAQAIHTQFFSLGDEKRNTTHAVKETVFSMNMKVGKFIRHIMNYNMPVLRCTLPIFRG